MVKVTIIIPTFNQSEYILQAINSALMQEYQNLEIIVGDDGSTDDTFEKANSICDPRLVCIKNPINLGRHNNYQKLLFKHATGDLVINLDGDDYFTDRSFVADAVKLMEKNINVVMVVAKVLTRSPYQDSISCLPPMDRVMGIEILKKLPKINYLLMHMGVLYRRDLALRLDFYKSSAISSDWESLYRLAIYGEVAYLDRVIGVWRIHGLNETGTVDPNKMLFNLSIWGSIYLEACKHGMPRVFGVYKKAQCEAYFGLSSFIRMATLGNISLINFFVTILRKYPLAGILMIINPKYSIRILLGFSGYYRRQRAI